MYEAIYHEAIADGSGLLGNVDVYFDGEVYRWLGWDYHMYDLVPNWLSEYGHVPMSGSELYVEALTNAVKKKWVVPTGQAFEDAFWQGADKASLVKDIEMWRPKSESFWGRMDDMSDAVPWGIDSHSKVRIYDGISDEYHWALITAQLSWRHDKEGGSSLEDPSFNVGKCEANISITRSYE
jgi:hypothetical protein